MTDDHHDDGLVHGHRWATEPPPSVGELLRQASAPRAERVIEEAHDDGLVHGHDWASAHSSRRFHG
ncbi:hypothetical protein DFH01_03260 [Falsiroseomonas bella]|uniref:Uncharacterized protein n=1 Tax=Falsiroseomonas bella TaxID=2184016 RepID=A0A317FGX7_9PROT|nr:hypothetical protein [Falsiroseomonas bella]PWS38321.1 hypothetical protein DFH01_03260 [Falsiroseomonas bella]